MSHELYSANDMVYVGEVPWHGLGVKVDRIDTLPSVLNWRIVPRPVYVEGMKAAPGGCGHNNMKHADAFSALVRSSDGKVMSVVTADYVPHQNSELWDTIFKPFIEQGELIAETAGMLQDGNRIWMLARIPNASFTLSGNDRNDAFMLLATSHDRSLATTAKPTAVRVVCQNTLSMAIGNNGKGEEGDFRQKHTSALRCDKAKEYVASAVSQFRAYRKKAEQLKASPVTPLQLLTYTAELVQPEQLIALDLPSRDRELVPALQAKQARMAVLQFDSAERKFREAMHKDATRTSKVLLDTIPKQQGGFDRTAWGLANGVSYWTDHVRGRSNDSRLNSAWFGPSDKLKRDAFELACDYAKAA